MRTFFNILTINKMRYKAIEDVYQVLDVFDIERITSQPLEAVEFLKNTFDLPYGTWVLGVHP